ncbi:MAG: PadR family transcriptional regulator [Eubacteriales bacterium]
MKGLIKTLILFYLSIKPTHGYEIQKFIQINNMDDWTKIQSGSIYYALSKLEKEGFITLFNEEKIGGKVRKIYMITDAGREILEQYQLEELSRDIYDVGSDKFIIYPILKGLDKNLIVNQVRDHISKLINKRNYIQKWQNLKVNSNTLKVEKLSYEMMLSNIDYQINWHEALIEDVEDCLELSNKVSQLIKKIDFSTIDDVNDAYVSSEKDNVEKLKQEILDNPENAEEKLEKLIKILGK